MKKLILSIACGIVLLGLAKSIDAANPASDSAADPVYNGGWFSGQNGGSGFQPWILTLSGTNAAHFIGTSVANGDGLDDGQIGGSANDSDIDTSGRSWGLSASYSEIATALRFFTGGALSTGETFVIDFDHGDIRTDFYIELSLVNDLGNPVFTLQKWGWNDVYRFSDGLFSSDTGVSNGTEGLTLSITMYDEVNYFAELIRRDGQYDAWNGTFSAPAYGFLARAFSPADDTPGPAYDFYINSMSIVPEPRTLALAGAALVTWSLRRIRRKSM